MHLLYTAGKQLNLIFFFKCLDLVVVRHLKGRTWTQRLLKPNHVAEIWRNSRMGVGVVKGKKKRVDCGAKWHIHLCNVIGFVLNTQQNNCISNKSKEVSIHNGIWQSEDDKLLTMSINDDNLWFFFYFSLLRRLYWRLILEFCFCDKTICGP